MSSQTVIHDLRCPCANTFETASAQDSHQAYRPSATRCNTLGLQDIVLDDNAGSTSKKEVSKNRTKRLDILANLLDILFSHHGEETYRGFEHEEMPPIVVNKYTGTFVQVELWESLGRWRY